MKKVYLKEKLSLAISESRNWSEVLRKLGMTIYGNNRVTLKKYAKQYNIDISHFETKEERYKRVNREIGLFKRIPIEKILVVNSTYNKGTNIKKRLYDKGLKKRICEKCGQDENWFDEKMSLILDHKNGIHDDNRLENLRILCPNCNATLPTHCRGSKGLKK